MKLLLSIIFGLWLFSQRNKNKTRNNSSCSSPIWNDGGINNFTLSMYLGKWYQIADFPQWYEQVCSDCTQTSYTLFPPRNWFSIRNSQNISVLNEAFDPSSQTWCPIRGIAFVPNPEIPTQLEVRFAMSPAVTSSNYWIIKLGRVVNNQYSLAVVTNSGNTTLYILSRKPTISPDIYQCIISDLSTEGFDVSKLKKTSQTCGPSPSSQL